MLGRKKEGISATSSRAVDVHVTAAAGGVVICQECKAEIHGAPKFCPKCGAKVDGPRQPASGTKVCPQCGAENLITAKFCKADGYRFELSGPATPDRTSAKSLSAAQVVPQTGGEPPPAPPVVLAPVTPSDPGAMLVLSERAVICPKCTTPNIPTVKFCRGCGSSLNEEVPKSTASDSAVATPTPLGSPTPRERAPGPESSAAWKVPAIAAAVLMVAGVAGWFGYSKWNGVSDRHIGATP